MDRRARWIERGWEGGDRRVSKLANRPTAYPLYPPGITEANVRSNVPPEGERERESADPFLPLAFDQRIPPSLSLPLIYPTLGIAKHLRQLCLRRSVPCVLPRGEGRREQTYFMPSFRIRVPFFVLARLINFTRTRVLIMTRAQRSARIFSRIDRTSQRYFLPFFLLFFSLCDSLDRR